MEYFDIVDEKGIPTGQTISREEAHREGYRHRTAHVWVVRQFEDHVEVLLQKRSDDKDSYPGCYDISSAGHIPAGVDYIPSALRELQEELGITAQPEELAVCGQCYDRREENFRGRPFVDDQVSQIFRLWWREDMVLTLQEEEVSGVLWMDLQDCMTAVGDGTIPHCIRLNELEMVRQQVQRELAEPTEAYPPKTVCATCGGHCCKTMGCSLAAGDLLRYLGRDTLDRQRLLKALEEHHLAIDRMSGPEGYWYFLRMQNKCFTFIGVDAFGECYALGENGCQLTEEERPWGGRSLEAVQPGCCVQHYTKDQMQADWRPYRRLLQSVWEEFEPQMTADGTFDRCEEAYMQWQMEQRKKKK